MTNPAKLSLDISAAMTGLSKRTLQRRVADGNIRKVAEDARGRTMLHSDDVLALLDFKLSADDARLLIEADSGQAAAQADMACVFHAADHTEAAVYLWRMAAEQGSADAMQNLGRCYASGDGVEQDENLALMWISKSAASGHSIAQGQIQSLIGQT